MNPETDIQQALSAACEHVGHWPYQHDAGVFVGYRPSGDVFGFFGDNSPAYVDVSYDMIIHNRRGYSEQAEQTRFDVYAALHDAGWTLEAKQGPETYVPEHELFCWPVKAVKRFFLSDGQPDNPAEV